jgi:hypothetical protein
MVQQHYIEMMSLIYIASICINIGRQLKEKKNFTIPKPSGYLQRSKGALKPEWQRWR